jgi:hypothetical protein
MRRRFLINGLAGASALALAAGHFANPDRGASELIAAPSVASVKPVFVDSVAGEVLGRPDAGATVASHTRAALDAFGSMARNLSHERALESAFRSFYAFKAKHPEKVRKPLLYFVDYGLPATAKRGYVFDMQRMKIVDGPFTVAHGRGSSQDRFGKPTRFSNRHGSAATSLGLYLAQETYRFSGSAAGGRYSSIGLRLQGLSGAFNSNARSRGVVAHGAPYVTSSRAGRSEGCPAVDQARAKTLLPKLANGGLVFLFAPDEQWLARDPWVTG